MLQWKGKSWAKKWKNMVTLGNIDTNFPVFARNSLKPLLSELVWLCECGWEWAFFLSFFYFCLGWLFFTCTTGICTRVHVQLSIVFFFCIPQLYLWGSPFWVRFLWVWPFLNPTIEVVIFRLCGWCMMGVFLLLTFTRLGHECQDLLSLGWIACVHRLDLSLYSHLEEFWGNGIRNHVNSKGNIPSTGGSEEGWSRNAAFCRTVNPAHYRLSYSGPWLSI